jgi:ribulose-phosphate 3-epimerase
VLPSLLLCDFAQLGREVQQLEAAGVPALHLDVMDGHFVNNLSYGLPLVETFRRLTDLPLDVHLMVSNPGDYLQRYAEAGADMITVHVEAVDEPKTVLEQIRAAGAGAGLAINPDTSLAAIETALDACDLLLVMSVMPGFGGQPFDPIALEKLRVLHARVAGQVLLEVDGGVNETTIGSCAEAGADLFVVGSAIFKHQDYSASVDRLIKLVQEKRG